MALIGTLRTKMTKVVVGLVAISMIFFIVGSDLFGSGPRSIFGGSKNIVGEINGHTIAYEEFNAAVQESETNYAVNMGRKPGERESQQLRQEAWEMLILKYAVAPEFEKVGVKVTSDEAWDMIQGKNIDPGIKSSFVDSTGNFNRSLLINWLQELERPEKAALKVRWDAYKDRLIPGRERLKYEYLLVKTNYVTNAEAEKDYHNQNDVIEAKYLFVSYNAISDTSVSPSDSELKTYYEKNKEKYKVEETRSLSYVVFPVIPSAKDSAVLNEELVRILDGFKSSTEDSLYATNNTEGKTPYEKYNAGTLPPFLSNQKENLKTGTIMGPVLENGVYKITKVVKVGKDTIFAARASHILFKWTSDTPEAKKIAKDKAKKALKELQGGADFIAKSAEYNEDQVAKARGGDLGWFSSGQMVKPFQNAVFAATKTGLLADVVESQFGYHVVKVTGTKDNTAYTVATIERELAPSDETHNESFRKAEAFGSGVKGLDEFKAKAAKENLPVFEGRDIATNERRLNNLGDARRVMNWLFRDASVGSVSEAIELDGNNIVAVMTGETEEGFKPFDKVKEEISIPVKNELKGKMIIDKLNAQKGTLEEIAKGYGPEAAVNTSSDLKLNTNLLPTVGFDPIAVGTAFSLESGKRSRPVAAENGVIIIEIQNKTIAPAVNDYTIFKNQALQQINNRVSYSVSEAIKKAANIKDNRYKFY